MLLLIWNLSILNILYHICSIEKTRLRPGAPRSAVNLAILKAAIKAFVRLQQVEKGNGHIFYQH